jgi:hypothetical protein
MPESETQEVLANYHRLLSHPRFKGEPTTLEDCQEALLAYKAVASDLAGLVQRSA